MNNGKPKTKFTRALLWSVNNLGWFIIFFMSFVIIIGTQLGTWHLEEGSIHDISNSYDKYGIIHNVKVVGEVPDDGILVEEYYALRIDQINEQIEDKREEIIAIESDDNLTEIQKTARVARVQSQITSYLESIDVLEREQKLIRSGVLSGLNSITLIKDGNQKFSWVAEYDITDMSKMFRLATTDVLAWILAILLAVMSFLTKIEGEKMGQKRGLQDFWPVTMLHSNLASKISPRSSDAERICIELNADELKAKRKEILQYVGLKYEDVFNEDGGFVSSPNFIKVETTAYKNNKGVVKYRTNRYQVRLLKKQARAVEKLKVFKIKEVHVHNLLEAKDSKDQRYDFGESLVARNRKSIVRKILTSAVTIAPLITATWMFTENKNPTMLIVAVSGILFNFVMMLFNMGGAIAYIADVYVPNISKRNDVMLEIGSKLKILTPRELNWYELGDDEKRKGKTLDGIAEEMLKK